MVFRATSPRYFASDYHADVPVCIDTDTIILQMQSDFYSVFSSIEGGVRLADLFSTQDPAIHKIQKRNVSNAYAMSSMLGMESLVNECTQVLMKKLQQKEQDSIDLGTWLQWYAFDVVGKITFSAQFGFMEEEKDVRDMISQIEKGLKYSAVVGQYPSLHRYLFLGNPLTKWIFKNIPSLAAQNPLVYIRKVDLLNSFLERCANNNIFSLRCNKSTGTR